MAADEESREQLLAELAETRERLGEALETLEAVRHGRLDAIVAEAGAKGIFPVGQRPPGAGSGAEQYRMLVEAIGDGAVMILADGTIIYCNSPFARMVGRRLEEVVGASFGDFLAETDRSRFADLLEAARHRVAGAELLLVGADGREVPVQVSLRFTQFNEMRGACIVLTDLTEHKRSQARIRNLNLELAGRIAQLIEASVDALAATDLELKITDTNERMVELTGYGREELIGTPLPLISTDPEPVRECLKDALASGLVRDFELNLAHRNGAAVPASLSARVLKDVTGKSIGLFVALHDIAERQARERERALLAAIVTSSPDAIYSLDADTTIKSWNVGAESLFGYGGHEIVGRSATILLPLSRRLDMLAHLAAVFDKGDSRRFDTVHLRKDGAAVEVALRMSPVRDAGGNITAAAVVGRALEAHEAAAENPKAPGAPQ